ncbi:MAG TPA: hypothetical protein VEU55_01105 [Gemmatimonadales bacterium]|nr:hypothetical protein [Gemmatimonadales bacterium]
MNRRLRELLTLAGIARGRAAPPAWSGVILLKNWGGVPAVRRPAATYLAERGFNLLLLGPRGVPTHFCKCRPDSNIPLRREVAVLTTLCRDPELSGIVPETWGVRGARVQLLISAYLPGTPLDRTVARLSPAQWADTTSEILTLVHRIGQRAAATLPEVTGAGAVLGLQPAARGALARLATLGLGRGSLIPLEEALRTAGTVPAFPQHGDLWPSNVVRSGGSWRLLDFEEFATVAVPLYDAWHLVRTCSDLRRGGGDKGTPRLWMDRLLAGDVEAEACWRPLGLAARRHALSAPQVVGTLGYYLIHATTQFHARGGPRSYWESHALELQRLSDILGSRRGSERFVTALQAAGAGSGSGDRGAAARAPD